MHFIQEGVVELNLWTGKEKLSETLSTGNHFGEMSILTHWKSDVTV